MNGERVIRRGVLSNEFVHKGSQTGASRREIHIHQKDDALSNLLPKTEKDLPYKERGPRKHEILHILTSKGWAQVPDVPIHHFHGIRRPRQIETR